MIITTMKDETGGPLGAVVLVGRSGGQGTTGTGVIGTESIPDAGTLPTLPPTVQPGGVTAGEPPVPRRGRRRPAATSTPPPPPTTGRWLSIKQVCERLGLSPSTIRRMKRSGELPPGAKFGGQLRWRESSIADYERAKEAEEAAAVAGV